MGPTEKMKLRIWLYYWDGHEKQRNRAIAVQSKLFYALSALIWDVSIIHSSEENWDKQDFSPCEQT